MSPDQWETANEASHMKNSFVQSQAANDYFSLLWIRMINVSDVYKIQKAPWNERAMNELLWVCGLNVRPFGPCKCPVAVNFSDFQLVPCSRRAELSAIFAVWGKLDCFRVRVELRWLPRFPCPNSKLLSSIHLTPSTWHTHWGLFQC